MASSAKTTSSKMMESTDERVRRLVRQRLRRERSARKAATAAGAAAENEERRQRSARKTTTTTAANVERHTRLDEGDNSPLMADGEVRYGHAPVAADTAHALSKRGGVDAHLLDEIDGSGDDVILLE
jgi:hypothetical protein